MLHYMMEVRECRGVYPGGSRKYGPKLKLGVVRACWADTPNLGRTSIGTLGSIYTVGAVYCVRDVYLDSHGLLVGTLPEQCVAECSHAGQCITEVTAWVRKLGFRGMILAHKAQAISYLREFGAWEDLNTCTVQTLAERVLWTACCEVAESGEWLGLTH